MRTNGPPDPPESDGFPQASDAPETIEAVHEALDQCPPPGGTPTANPWKDLLYDRLHDEALPAIIADGTITPAASLWTGSRLWVQAFRDADVSSGDRLVIALPPSTAFVQVLVAALWEGCTVALVSPREDIPALLDTLDARAAVTPDGGPHAWSSDEYAGPQSTPTGLRPPNTASTPDVRFLLRTSGTTDHAKWVALSDRNVLSVLASHLPHFSLHDARVLSVLPWTHAFGLVLDFFPALLSGSELIRDPNGGRDPGHLVHLRNAWGATHLSAVPLTIQRLLDTGRGATLLQQLQGGIVGGAPVSGPLAEALEDTALRVGYGLTEAGPGVALGPKGTWAAHYLGRPVGCSVEIADDGELFFKGPNACVGIWRDGALDRADPDRLVPTGDLVKRDGDDLFFQGRKDHSFKLLNGRLVKAGALEADLKTQFPELSDALVFTPNSTDVAVALCVPPDVDRPPSSEDVRAVLGPLGERLVWTTAVPPESWTTLAKGSVDRDAMTTRLTDMYQSTS